MEKEKNKRKSKEIKIENYDNIYARIGTVEDKSSPDTVYINLSFWVNIKDEDFDINSRQTRHHLENKITKEFNKKVLPIINSSNYLAHKDEIIFLINIPESINTNKHKNFVDIELFLYTINTISKDKKYPLNTRRNVELYSECIKICDTFSKFDVLNGRDIFIIKKKSS